MFAQKFEPPTICSKLTRKCEHLIQYQNIMVRHDVDQLYKELSCKAVPCTPQVKFNSSAVTVSELQCGYRTIKL